MTDAESKKDQPVTPREAATVVLMRDREGGLPEVLMLQRHAEDKFAAGAYVFPGGMLEPQDYEPQALAISPLSPQGAVEELHDVTPPEKALGFFIAAIRETFEEAGILLASSDNGDPWHPGPGEQEGVHNARRALHDGNLNFSEWVAEQGLQLATDRFCYFAHWITPIGRPIRFSARFFATEVAPHVEAVADEREVEAPIWVTPGEVLERFEKNEVKLVGATRANLGLLSKFQHTKEALAALKARKVETIMPKLKQNQDGSFSPVFPWDPLYQTL